MVKWMAVLVSASLALAAAAALLQWLPFHPSRERFPVRGIDVSHHQGEIDWKAVASGDAGFAYIKATEGGDWVDPQFARNWREARAAGVPRGAYHFFTLCRPGQDQADNLIATAPVEAGMLPPAVDLEHVGNCADGPGRLDFEREFAIFREAVEVHYGRALVIYTTDEFFHDHLAGETLSNPLWLRSMLRRPNYGGRDWTFWQYSAFGRSPGIAGPVDWNVFAGSEAAFEAGWAPPRR